MFPVIDNYGDILVKYLRREAEKGKPVPVKEWVLVHPLWFWKRKGTWGAAHMVQLLLLAPSDTRRHYIQIKRKKHESNLQGWRVWRLGSPRRLCLSPENSFPLSDIYVKFPCHSTPQSVRCLQHGCDHQHIIWSERRFPQQPEGSFCGESQEARKIWYFWSNVLVSRWVDISGFWSLLLSVAMFIISAFLFLTSPKWLNLVVCSSPDI